MIIKNFNRANSLSMPVLILLLLIMPVSALLAAPKSYNYDDDQAKVEAIFAAADIQGEGLDQYLLHVAEDVILMPHNAQSVEGKEAYKAHIEQGYSYGTTTIEHQLISAYSYPDLVIARGRAVGTFQANGSDNVDRFETKNVFIFRRLESSELQVWQIIFNMNP